MTTADPKVALGRAATAILCAILVAVAVPIYGAGCSGEECDLARSQNYEYLPISATDTSQCIERVSCLMPRDGYLRFGNVGRRENWTYSVWIPQGNWFDCSNQFFGWDPIPRISKICEISVETEAPTLEPTRAPQFSPTLFPTLKPTHKPTNAAPTPEPSAEPTTSAPSLEPTTPKPTTVKPSKAPSNRPSEIPTSSPTVSPTIDVWALCLSMRTESTCENIAGSDLVDQPGSLCEWSERAGRCVARIPVVETKAPTTNVGAQSPSSGADSSEPQALESWVTIVATNIAILGMVLSLSALGFIYVHRQKPVIQLSQCLFLQLICVGAVAVNAAIFPYAFPATSSSLCLLRKWWFDLAFCFTLSVMLVKVWRVWRVFSAPVSRTSHITNAYLLKRVLAILVVDAIFLAVWTALDDVHVDYSAAKDAYACRYGNSGAGTAFYALTYVFLALLVLATAVLACRVKDLGSVLGESKQLYWITNNILVFASFNAVLGAADSADQNVRVMVFSLSVLICTVIALVVLLLAKYERFGMSREEILRAAMEKKRSSVGSGGSGGPADASTSYVTSNNYNYNNSTSNSKTGFLDGDEVLNVSGNAAAVKIYRDHRDQVQVHRAKSVGGLGDASEMHSESGATKRSQSTRGWFMGGARTTQEPPVKQESFRMSGHANTDNAAPFEHEAQSSFSWLRRSNESVPESVPEDRPTQDEPQVNLDLLAHRPRRGSDPDTLSYPRPNALMSPRKAQSERHVDVGNDAPATSSNKEVSSNGEKVLFTASTNALDAMQSDEPSFGNAAQLSAPTYPPTSKSQSDTTKVSISNGFKIGERGSYEEYVHRETGESFWLDTTTGEIVTAPPDGVALS